MTYSLFPRNGNFPICINKQNEAFVYYNRRATKCPESEGRSIFETPRRGFLSGGFFYLFGDLNVTILDERIYQEAHTAQSSGKPYAYHQKNYSSFIQCKGNVYDLTTPSGILLWWPLILAIILLILLCILCCLLCLYREAIAKRFGKDSKKKKGSKSKGGQPSPLAKSLRSPLTGSFGKLSRNRLMLTKRSTGLQSAGRLTTSPLGSLKTKTNFSKRPTSITNPMGSRSKKSLLTRRSSKLRSRLKKHKKSARSRRSGKSSKATHRSGIATHR